MGRWEVLLPSGAWVDERSAEDAGIPLVEPLPTHTPSPVVVRRGSPEVPPMPSPAPTPRPPARGPGAPPSPAQEQAWKAVTERGLYWPDVARELGTTAWSVKNMIQAYMRRNGIPGEPPGRTPKDEVTRRTMAAKGQKREAAAPNSAPNSGPADAFDGASDRLVLAPEGHPWATDPEPIDLVEPAADHAETIPVAEPAPQLLGHLPSSDQPRRTGGGGRDVNGDDFLARIERELDALASEDAALVEEARRIVAARTDVAARIERLRTAGEVYRAVMAGRAA